MNCRIAVADVRANDFEWEIITAKPFRMWKHVNYFVCSFHLNPCILQCKKIGLVLKSSRVIKCWKKKKWSTLSTEHLFGFVLKSFFFIVAHLFCNWYWHGNNPYTEPPTLIKINHLSNRKIQDIEWEIEKKSRPEIETCKQNENVCKPNNDINKITGFVFSFKSQSVWRRGSG